MQELARTGLQISWPLAVIGFERHARQIQHLIWIIQAARHKHRDGQKTEEDTQRRHFTVWWTWTRTQDLKTLATLQFALPFLWLSYDFYSRQVMLTNVTPPKIPCCALSLCVNYHLLVIPSDFIIRLRFIKANSIADSFKWFGWIS